MKSYSIIFIFILFCSCHSEDDAKIYKDSSHLYYVNMEESERDGSKDTLYTFSNFNNPSQIREVGFYKHGFRNDKWSYNMDPGVKTFVWGYYKDKYLEFETNVFSNPDSIKYGDSFTKFLFSTESGKVSLSVSVNGPLKDSLPEKNSERLTKAELVKIGVDILSYTSEKITNVPNNIYMYSLRGKFKNQMRYLKGCYSFLDKEHFVEFSVSHLTEKDISSNILFDAVLTNFYINGKRLYNPFR